MKLFILLLLCSVVLLLNKNYYYSINSTNDNSNIFKIAVPRYQVRYTVSVYVNVERRSSIMMAAW